MADPVNPYEVVATALKQIIDTEFAPEGITAIHDNIHESLGEKRVTVGIAPLRDSLADFSNIASNQFVEIRFYDLWDKKVDPAQTVNPMKITMYAERLKQAIRRSHASFPGSGEVWYFDWRGTDYPNDPTGNKTRFHMTVRAFGTNTAINETTG